MSARSGLFWAFRRFSLIYMVAPRPLGKRGRLSARGEGGQALRAGRKPFRVHLDSAVRQKNIREI
ncbi:hypothetical protein D7X94_00855 [Acutalibacter sp. 1XD8-33]|nr:hypothetical protein D7X94_00855 [Acutalibacter sp. 1XD8-33]